MKCRARALVGGPDLLKNLGAKIFEKRQRMKLYELLAEEEGVGGRGKGQKMKIDANANAVASIYLAERSAHFVDVSRVRPETIVHACGKHAWAQEWNARADCSASETCKRQSSCRAVGGCHEKMRGID